MPARRSTSPPPGVTTKRRDVGRALTEIVLGDDAVFHALWDGLTSLQQNVLRAVAGGEIALHVSVRGCTHEHDQVSKGSR